MHPQPQLQAGEQDGPYGTASARAARIRGGVQGTADGPRLHTVSSRHFAVNDSPGQPQRPNREPARTASARAAASPARGNMESMVNTQLGLRGMHNQCTIKLETEA